ncbi:MAG: VWA domain-containing protein [Geminicoccaceae bacterium]
MTGKQLTPGRRAEVDAFLEQVRRTAPRTDGARGRLIFALDATASRQPTWDRAAHVQGQMFVEADRLGGLDVQLVYYRGFAECRASRWVARPAELLQLMSGVTCAAGHTQIARVLRHALKQAQERRLHAVVFVGDCCEESIDELGHLAGQLGLQGVKAFMFREGSDADAERAFAEVARLTGGAHCRFDASAPDELRQLLGAVAAFAAGGRQALLAAAGKASAGPVRLLASQVR